MRPLITLCLLFLLLLPLCVSAAQKNTCDSPASIEDACKSVAAARPDLGLDFCIETLKSDSGTKSTNLRGLAAAAIRQAIAHATSTESKVEDLLDLEPSGPERKRLHACVDAYSDAIEHMQNALDSLNAGIYTRTMSLLVAALNAADKCEEAFKEVKGLASPVASVDRDYSRLAGIALIITKSIE